MRPCDCKSIDESMTMLHEQGIKFNDEGITVEPNRVIIEVGPCRLIVSMKRFKQWAEWYLEDQLTEPPRHDAGNYL